MTKIPIGSHLFTFVVIADTHMNQKEDYSSSPYPCNVLANARTRQVIAEINQVDPVLVVHLGDIVNPVPELPTYGEAAGHFKQLVEDLGPPLHLVPGNHDVGDKPVSWAAGVVNDENLALYESHFGKHYFAFDHEHVHFVVINSPIINSGLAVESEQRAWLEQDLEANKDQRTFIFIHYPPYVSDPVEPGSYDNIDEPGRTWLLSLIRKYTPEGMFCGHVHNFWYDIYEQTEIYLVPSTAFVRHGYSEFFRVGPADQYGRNDVAKLGYSIVRVYEKGYVAENVRTYGRALEPGGELGKTPVVLPTVQTKEQVLPRVALDMRHAWAEEVEIPPSGALDEFERKKVRNDYPLLALWEMGIQTLRVPLQDLLDDRVSRRMSILKQVGHRFQVFLYGGLAEPSLARLIERSHLVDYLEVVVDWDRVDSSLAQVQRIAQATDIQVYLSRVNRRDAEKRSGDRYHHLISHGFTLDEADDLRALQQRASGLLDGVIFKVTRAESPWQVAGEAQALANDLNAKAVLYLKSSSASPAESFEHDESNAARIAEGILAVAAYPRVETILDTFVDADRGYFARNGLVDRRYNPRLGSRVVSGLCALLNERSGWSAVESLPAGSVASIMSKDGHCLSLQNIGDGPAITLLTPSGERVLSLSLGKNFL